MGPTWVLSAPIGPHIGPMNLVITGHNVTNWISLYVVVWNPVFRSQNISICRVPSLAMLFNSLAPGGFENIFQNVFFKLISWIDTLSNSCETALRSMPQNPSDDKSTLVQVMAWCRQAASHYLSQCCPRSLSPYGVTRPQWVNSLRPSNAYMRRQPRPSFVQVTACRLFGAKPLSEPMLY